MSRRLLIILIVLASMVLIGTMVLFFLSKPTAPTPSSTPAPAAGNNLNSNPAVNEPVNNTEIPLNYNNEPLPVAEEVDDKTQIKNIATRFTEKYGTYSTDASFANLKNLSYLLTDSMKLKIQNVIQANSLTQNIILPFYGVTTKAVVVNSVKFITLTEAQVVLTTQRSEVFSRSGSPILRYQDITVSLEKVNKQWLVNEVEWTNNNNIGYGG